MMIDGLAGPMVLTSNAFTGSTSMTVAGMAAHKHGRREFSVPTAEGGMAAAAVYTRILDPYPTIVIDGVEHRTGPALPLALRLLSWLPFVILPAAAVNFTLPLGKILPYVIAGACIAVNFAVLRGSQTTAVKALLMVLVPVGGIAALLLVAIVLVALGLDT
jgi:hypothetical protein